MSDYKIQAYVSTGYYEYPVDTLERAIDHAQQIIARGCIRATKTDDMIDIVPVYKVRIIGEGCGSKYPVTFHRT